ncbi:MAG: hypothetical protein A2Y74_02150 [Actinobacteria bacterium RBG_13_63_9]|nr:MAG: hypothetical protein A2Y74_02150 [Actinobacteria bacterium RBG_13_63_9]
MRIDLRSNQDFFAGLLFIAFGLVAVVIAFKNYPVGTSFNMGPGYFPTLLGGILTFFGVYLLLRGLIRRVEIEGVWGIRPLALITLGIVAFGFLMDRLGMVVALLALFFISALGGHEFKFKEVLILTVVMTVACWGIFIYGLALPYRLFFWGN